MPSLSEIDLLELLANNSVDKIISDFDGNTTTHSVSAATLSGGVYLPQTSELIIANPTGKKAFPTMVWSIDDSNYYPARPKLFQPGNPIPEGRLGATVGMMVNAQQIKFYFVHYYGVTVNFKMFWVLDNIL